MKQAYIYKDDKSKKFWWIHYSETEFVVNYGKTGAIGKYLIKEFESAVECEKEAKKTIAKKVKKGYVLDPKFNFQEHLYFDDEDYGLHSKTSHPNFVKSFKEEFYYDCTDEEAPFGSDEGADTLFELEEFLRKNKESNLLQFPKKIIEKSWDMEYIPPTDLNEKDFRKQLEEKEDNGMLIFQTDQVVVAVVIGQIKITGKIDLELKRVALLSLKRISMYAKIKEWGDSSEINLQIISDLEAFK